MTSPQKPVIEYLCDFEGDGKPGACLRSAEWKIGKYDLCSFHAGFMYSVDRQKELPKPRRLSYGR